MATILLGALGSAIGTSIGGSVLGIGAAVIGKAIGSAAGNLIDQSFIAMLTPDEQIYGPEVGNVSMSLPNEGEMLARGAGWQKLPARMIWPETLHFAEESETVSTGGKGAQNKSSTTTYHAEVTIAVAIRDGETDLFGRCWADGSLVDLHDLCNSVTIYKGSDTQDADPTLEAVDGAGNVPDWRGVTYMVLEGFDLSSFGNRIPQLEFETFTGARGTAQAFQGITLLPTAGEFGLDPQLVTEQLVETIEEASGPEEVVIDESPVNNNAVANAADIQTSLELLGIQQPQIKQVVIEYPWFGDDLRCGECEIAPRVEMASRETAPSIWLVQGIARGAATIVNQVDGARAYAGTPSDAGVIRLIGELRSRGYSVTLSPRILMDIPEGNGKLDPHGGVEQGAFADRSKITCTPAPGQAGSVDKTATASAQVDAFFGSVTAADYSVTGEAVVYAGAADDWGYSRFILHAAALIKAAGGVNALLIGSGLTGMTKIRSDATTFPAVSRMVDLHAEVRAALMGVFTGEPVTVHTIPSPGDDVVLPDGDRTQNPASLGWKKDVYSNDSSSMTYSHESIFTEHGVEFDVGSDGYFLECAANWPAYIYVDAPIPIGKWQVKAAFGHAKSGGNVVGTRKWSLRRFTAGSGNIGGDITAGKTVNHYPFSGFIDWSEESYAGIVEDGSTHVRFSYYFAQSDALFRDLKITIGGLVEIGYAANWREYGAYAPGDGSGDVFFPLDDLWAVCDFVAVNYRAPLADLRDGDDGSIYDINTLKSGIESGENYDWVYLSEADRQARLRTSISDTVHGEPWIYRAKDIYGWWSNAHHARPAGVRDAAATAWQVSSKPVRLFYGCPAVDRGANQPEVEINPNASAFAYPHFSNGARDDDSQATYIRAVAEFWATDARGMVDVDASAVEGWDARPWPVYPHTDLWPDAAAWPISSSMAGRNIIDISSWLASELDYRGLDYELDQVTGSIDGITVSNLAGFMSVAGPVLGLFHLDASEVDGQIKITSRAVQVADDDIDFGAVIPLSKRDRFRVDRGNQGQLPAIAHLTHRDIGHDYDSNTVNSRLNRDGSGESYTDAPVVIDPQTAGDLIRTKHLDGVVATDKLECKLPPSWLPKLVPGKTIRADTGLGAKEWLILKRDIGEGVTISTRRLDRAALRPNPTVRIGYQPPRVSAYGATAMALPDLPWISSSDPAHDLRAAIWVDPAQGNALMRSLAGEAGYSAVGQFASRATMGVLTASLDAGTVYGWDRGNTISLRLFSGSLVTRPEIDVRAGQNWLAVRTDAVANTWELLAFRDAYLAGDGAYDLTHLLRGLRGSQVVASVASGALVVLLDGLPFAGLEIDNIGTPFWWSAGPSAKPRTDASWVTRQVTPSGAGLKPFAPARVAGEIVSGDLELVWSRQDRDPRATQLDRSSIPMSEDTLEFVVSIGGVTWSFGAEGATIPAASLPSLPFDVTVQQVSGDVGLGHPTTITME